MRLLQLIGDTDVEPSHVAALALHRGLAGAGHEVRTLALAPGRRGGLEVDVPAVAPSRRSFAARGVVSHESRWADAVVLHGPRSLTPATSGLVTSGTRQVVIALWTALPERRSPSWSAHRRMLRAAARTVVPDDDVAASVRRRATGSPRLVVVPSDLGDPGRPVVDTRGWLAVLAELVP